MRKSDITKRMKEYEGVSQNKLTRRMPVVIRIDGKAFHSFTRGFKRPFDDFLIKSMQYTMKYLCENIQGCVLGYHQSDEISLLLIDYQKLESAAWFDNKVQKICSISASIATMVFNKVFDKKLDEKYDVFLEAWNRSDKEEKIFESYFNSLSKGAMFDARCFNIPKEEVANYFYWRQIDAIRNSVQMVGQANFTRKDLHGKSCNMIQDMLMTQKGINWNDFPVYQKRGSCCIKKDNQWIIDSKIPVFKGEDRKYIEDLIYIKE